MRLGTLCTTCSFTDSALVIAGCISTGVIGSPASGKPQRRDGRLPWTGELNSWTSHRNRLLNWIVRCSVVDIYIVQYTNLARQSPPLLTSSYLVQSKASRRAMETLALTASSHGGHLAVHTSLRGKDSTRAGDSMIALRAAAEWIQEVVRRLLGVIARR
jgi:hypothetical protein